MRFGFIYTYRQPPDKLYNCVCSVNSSIGNSGLPEILRTQNISEINKLILLFL